MCAGRLRGRVPSATFVRIAKLMGHSFRFHKRSIDGSAKGNAFEAGNPSDFVWGVIFDIDDSERPRLDDAEGLGAGYGEKSAVVVDDREQEHRVVFYVAEANSIGRCSPPLLLVQAFRSRRSQAARVAGAVRKCRRRYVRHGRSGPGEESTQSIDCLLIHFWPTVLVFIYSCKTTPLIIEIDKFRLPDRVRVMGCPTPFLMLCKQ
jgi:hypothetical protein